jgi:hypothetical protein
MRRWRRTLREILGDLRLSAEEREIARTEQCLEACFDPECAPGQGLCEQEEAELEAERRRWSHPGPRALR